MIGIGCTCRCLTFSLSDLAGYGLQVKLFSLPYPDTGRVNHKMNQVKVDKIDDIESRFTSLTLLAVPLTGWAQENASADNQPAATLPLNTETHAIEQLSSVPETVVSGYATANGGSFRYRCVSNIDFSGTMPLALLETGGTVVVILLLMSLVAMTIVLDETYPVSASRSVAA